MTHQASAESGMDTASLIEGYEETHRPLPVTAALSSQLLLMISLLCGVFILPVLYENQNKFETDTFSALSYYHLIIWMAITVMTWYVKAEHKKSRIYGYHEFYDSTRHLHRVAFYLLCGGNVLLLVISCVTHNFCLAGAVSPCSLNISLSPVNYVQLILVLEIALAVPFLIKHIVEVIRFNQRMAPPDVLRGQVWHPSEQDEIVIGVRGSDYTERLLNHQADQLMTLNRRNQMLQQQLYALMHLHSTQQSVEPVA